MNRKSDEFNSIKNCNAALIRRHCTEHDIGNGIVLYSLPLNNPFSHNRLILQFYSKLKLSHSVLQLFHFATFNYLN